MRTAVRNGLVAVAIGALGSLGVPAAGAQDAGPTMTVDPTTITFGTPMTISGTGCVDPDTLDGTGLWVLVLGRSLRPPHDMDPVPDALGLVAVQPDGTWTLAFTVPEQAPNFDPQEDFSRNIRAACARLDPGETVFDYPEVRVDFVMPEVTTTGVPTTSAPSTTPPVVAPGPAPAVPIPTTSTFTG